MKKYTFIIFSLIFFSCEEVGNNYILPKSTGGIREMVVVYDDTYEKTNTLKLVDRIFQKPVEYIMQDEPTFKVLYMPKKAFASNRLIKYFRNVLYLNKSKKDTIFFKRNIFSKPQLALFVNATTEKKARHILYKNRKSVFNHFKKNDDDYIKNIHEKNKWKNPEFLKDLDFILDIPKDYSLSLKKENFIWLTKDLRKGYYNILIYENNLNGDFSKENIYKQRDFFTKKYIHGTLKNSYVKVEDRFPSVEEHKKIDGLFVLKLTGMWKMENDFMGGNFINYTIVDELSNKVYSIDGFVYLPSNKKNPALVEIDNILSSFKLKK